MHRIVGAFQPILTADNKNEEINHLAEQEAKKKHCLSHAHHFNNKNFNLHLMRTCTIIFSKLYKHSMSSMALYSV